MKRYIIKDNNKTELNNVQQAELLDLFLYAQTTSKTLRTVVMASKADTDGNGGSLAEAFIKRNMKENVANLQKDNLFLVGNWEARFDKNGVKTMLGTYYENSIENMIDVMGPSSILGTSSMQYTINEMMKSIDGEYPTDPKKYNKLYQMAYAVLLSETDVFNKGTNNDRC